MKTQDIIFTPTDLVASINQTFEYAYPKVIVEGELSEFRISKNRWVYFNLKDDLSCVAFFGSVYQLPGPLEDGMVVRVVGMPRLHPRYGFSVSFSSIGPVGEGSLKKAADLLRAKLEGEGLFAPERKRLLPEAPAAVGLITAASSAACGDFMKVLNERWGGVEVSLVDTLVQGERAPGQLVKAIEYFNKLSDLPEVLVVIRGGGGAEDLAAFNDERVVRAVAGSRIPSLVAVGHEVDVSLAELAADLRASTPSHAAATLFPDKRLILKQLADLPDVLSRSISQVLREAAVGVTQAEKTLSSELSAMVALQKQRLASMGQIIAAFNPRAVLARGYALVSRDGKYITSAGMAAAGDRLNLQMRGGTINSTVESIDAEE